MHHKRKNAKSSTKSMAFAQLASDQMQQSEDKKAQTRKRMRVVQLQRKLDKQEQFLKQFPVHPVAPKPVRPKGPKQDHEYKLKGAARPWALVEKIANGELNEDGEEFAKPVETYDLYALLMHTNQFGKHDQSLAYLQILKSLAQACCDAGLMERGIKNYELCMQLDPTDQVRSREGLVCAFLDEGKGAEARQILDQYQCDDSAVLAYCRVLLEYISWEVLEEKDSSEEVVRAAFLKALDANKFIAVFLACHETFLQVVEYVEDIENPTKGSIEESFVYCCHNIGVWVDTVGACAWIQKELDAMPRVEAKPENAQDEMYFGMFETAMEMHEEAQAALLNEEEGGEEGDEDEDDDEEDGDDLDEPAP